MPCLSFDDKVVLTLYKKFFGENYPGQQPPVQGGEPEDLTDKHVKAQKMCYLLDLAGIRVGGYTYSWNTYGSFSSGLQAQLRELDCKSAEAVDYYNKNLSDDILFAAEGDENIFMPKDRDTIMSLLTVLHIPQGNKEAREWVERLGSMAYISQNVFPYGRYEWVRDELVRRKSKYDQEDKNKEAWDILSEAKLLSVC